MSANPGGLVYGTIAVGALLAAETAQRETYAETVGAVVITLVLYWLAHAYAEFTARRVQTGTRLTRAGLARAMGHELSVLIGAAVPLLTLLIWWAAGGTLSAAVSAAVWTSAVMIVLIEVVAGVRARLSGRDLAAQIILGALLGLLVILLKAVLH